MQVNCNLLKMKMFSVKAEQYQSTGCWELLWAAYYEGRVKESVSNAKKF